MKKIVSLILGICIMVFSAIPTLALSGGSIAQPYGALSLRGGMVYDLSEGKYYIYGAASGSVEWKQVTVVVYLKMGSTWMYKGSATATGTDSTVTAGKHVSLEAGQYRIYVTGKSGDSEGSVSYYYEVD